MSVVIDYAPRPERRTPRAVPERSLSPLALQLMLGSLLLVLAVVAVHVARPILNRPLQALRVDGQLSRLTPLQVATAAGVTPDEHLFDADLAAVRARIEALPWVAQARVSRVWPDRIAIRVRERRPYARWGESALLDEQGRIFVPSAAELDDAAFKSLPQLAAPTGREAEAMKTYVALAAALAGTPFAPVSVTLDARGEWISTTAQGLIVRYGEGDPLAKVPLLRDAVQRALGERIATSAAIDLRYTNGFAVAERVTSAAAPLSPNAAPVAVAQPTPEAPQP
jgi:cell division protein FtsQ